jgi:GNAT superfamily N-acetyltransferase
MIEVRPFTPSDSEEASNIIVRCLREVNRNEYTEGQIERLCNAFSPAKLDKRFSDRKSFVAVMNDSIVGTATIKHNELGSVFVDPDFHRRGVGRILVDFIESLARRDGITLLKANSSLTAVNFYQQLGYEILGERCEPDGEVTIEIEKQLTP